MPTPEQIAQAAEVLGVEPTKLQEDLEFSNPDPALVARGEEIEQEWRQAKAHDEEKTALVAATEAAAAGELSSAQVALALNAAGLHNAHDAWVQSWQAEEESYAAQDDAESLEFLDAAEYARRFASQQIAERAEAEATAADLQRQIRVTQVEDLQKDLKAFVDSTPGAHRFAPAIEQRLVRDLQASGELPSTPEARAAAIETALRTEVVVTNESESIRQQVNDEWRIQRKQNGARDGLTSAADIDRAKAHYIEERTKQLNDARMVNMEALKPAETPDEIASALAEKYRAKQEKSVAFHKQVEALTAPSTSSDRGVARSREDRAYREAYARAEETAAYGEVRTTQNGVQPVSGKAGYGPNGDWPDELGPAI